MTLYRGRFRIESARLPGWDYTSAGWYFVTLCTHRRARVLSEIRNGRVRLSDIGRIVADEWQRTPHLRPRVALDAWVIMPDHLHGIIRITAADGGGGDTRVSADIVAAAGAAPSPSSDAEPPAETRISTDIGKSRPRLQSGSLGAIIGQFKSVCTKRIRAAGHSTFAWQPRFYDSIIRDADGLRRVRRYIAANPGRWERDRGRSEGLYM